MSAIAPDSVYSALPKRVQDAVGAKNVTKPGPQYAETLAHTVLRDHAHQHPMKANTKPVFRQLDVPLMLDNIPEQFRSATTTKAVHGTKSKKARKQRTGMSSREKRVANVFALPRESCKFELLMPLHHLWVQYATDLRSSGNEKASSSTLPPAPTDPFLPKLAKMDFHGAILTVTKSTTPSLIGQSGIMVMETAKTFKLVTRQNTLKLVTKTGTVFALKLGNVVYTVYGSAIQYRSSERAGRKFKAKPTIDL